VLAGVVAALLVLYGPTAHYVAVYPSPTVPGGVVSVAYTTGCVSQLDRWREPAATLATSPLGRRDRGYWGTNALSAGSACAGAINGRDHLALALIIGAVILGVVTRTKRRDPSETLQMPAPTST